MIIPKQTLFLTLPLLALVTLLAFGCGGNKSVETPPINGTPSGEPLVLPKPSHQAFLESLRKDCLTIKHDPTFLRRMASHPPDEVETKAENYCTCFVDEFNRQFSTQDLNNFLEKNNPLPSNVLDQMAETCSIHIEE